MTYMRVEKCEFGVESHGTTVAINESATGRTKVHIFAGMVVETHPRRDLN
jgi:hypothetical protein